MTSATVPNDFESAGRRQGRPKLGRSEQCCLNELLARQIGCDQSVGNLFKFELVAEMGNVVLLLAGKVDIAKVVVAVSRDWTVIVLVTAMAAKLILSTKRKLLRRMFLAISYRILKGFGLFREPVFSLSRPVPASLRRNWQTLAFSEAMVNLSEVAASSNLRSSTVGAQLWTK